VDLLLEWCQTQPAVLKAFITHDELEKRIKRAVHKVKLEQSPAPPAATGVTSS
jgi:hypothetical protein